MQRQVQLTISGRVQGVFYRASAKNKAQELGITGTIRNASNGNVLALAQGDESAIQTFIAWCEQGPTGSRVDSVLVKEEALTQLLEAFRIL